MYLYVGGVFSAQLKSLMTTLYDTTPHFVRCIKPNSVKKPCMFDWDYVKPQLECGGIIEALRILKCGFPTRTTYEEVRVYVHARLCVQIRVYSIICVCVCVSVSVLLRDYLFCVLRRKGVR